MNFPTQAPGLRHPPGPRGVALVVTLMMMSVLVMMVVGLAGVMRNEQAAARNLTYQAIADQMADLGVRAGMAAVLSNSTSAIGRPPVTGPGWMVVNGNRTALFSSNASGLVKNVEEIGTNSMILGLPDTTRGQLNVSWSNLVDPGGVLVGRYAWWVDDEGTKVNLNAVGSNNTNIYLPLLTKFPISADYLFVDPATGQTNAASFIRARALAGRANPLPTTESLKDTNVITGLTGANGIDRTAYRRAKGHVTAWSSNVDLTPWGTAKISLESANIALTTNQIMAVLTTNAWTNLFDAGASLARKYGGGSAASANAGNHGDLVLQQITANLMAARGTPVLLTNPLRDYQVSRSADNIARHRNSMPLRVASHYQGPFLEQVRARVDWQITGQTNVVGRLLIWVRVINPTTKAFNGWSVKVQPRKWKYVVAPVSGPGFAGAKAANLVYGSPLGGFPHMPDEGFNVVPGPGWEVPSRIFNKSWPLDRFYVSNNLTFSARSTNDLFFSNVISFTLANVQPNELPATVSRAYVMLDQVGLYESSTPSVTSLRDWLTHDDLAQLGNYRNDGYQDYGQFSFHPGLYPGAGNAPINVSGGFPSPSVSLFGANSSLGVRKIDPQARFHVNFFLANATQPSDMGRLRAGGWTDSSTGPRAWTTNATFSCTNTNGSVTGISYLWPDPAPGVNDVLDHPHFVEGYLSTNGIKSVAQLGAIHTGIPWRTLRLGPTPATELAQGPPDWILLDVFTATNPSTPLPTINVNGLPMALAGTNLGLATNVNGTLPNRQWGLVSAMASAASPVAQSSTSTLASNGVPVSLANPTAPYRNLAVVASNLTAVLSNPSLAGGWSTASDWRNFRAGRSAYPTNVLLLRGEILEVRGMAEDTNNPTSLGEDVIEGRLRSFLDLVSTRSDTFSVWSVGQGLQVVTNRGNRTNIMGEVRKQTVFQRVPQTNSSGTLTGYQLKLLYTRNHLVE